MGEDSLSVALIQMYRMRFWGDSLKKAEGLVMQCALKGAKLIILPENFISHHETREFEKNKREYVNRETFQLISRLAKQLNVYIVAGTVVMKVNDTDLPFSTCRVFGPDGQTVCTFKKIHIVREGDVGIGVKVDETNSIQGGCEFSVFHIGCNVLIFPASYECTETGPMEWEVTNRARAIDNQMYVISVSPARNTDSKYQSYGHSMIVDPHGKMLCQAGFEEEIVYGKLDLNEVKKIRKKHRLDLIRRNDMYCVQDLTKNKTLKSKY